MLLVKHLLEPYRIKFINTWLQYQKSMYIDKLDDIVNKFNNIYHKIMKIKPIHVNPSMYYDFIKENNKEDPKFKVNNYVKISKYINIFANVCVPNWSKDLNVFSDWS